MKLSDKINMAFKDVVNRKFRSFLTILAISVGSLLLVAMLGLGDGISKQFDDMISQFGNSKEISIITLGSEADMGMGMSVDVEGEETNIEGNEEEKTIVTSDNAKTISEIDGVDYVLASIKTNISATKIDDGDYVEKSESIVGVNLDYSKNFSDEVVAGSGFSGEEKEILVTEKYLDKIDVENYKDVIGKILTIKVEFPAIEGMEQKKPYEIEGKIVGVLGDKAYFTSGLVMSDKDVEGILSYLTGSEDYLKNNGYSNISAFIEDDANVTKVSNKITKETGYMTFTLELMRTMINVVTKVVKSILAVGGIIVIVVAALGLVNTMTMTLQEKRKMIGVMRSVGASRGKIRIIFIFQSIMLGLAGGALGSILAGIGIFISNKWILADSSFTIGFGVNNVVIAMVITLIISLLAGLIPSGRAAKLNVVEAVAEE